MNSFGHLDDFMFSKNRFKGEEGGEEEELRSLKEVGVNRVYVCRTSLVMA